MRLDLPMSDAWDCHRRPPGLPEVDYLAAQKTRGAWTCPAHALRRPHVVAVRSGILALRCDAVPLTARGGQVLLFAAGTRIAPATGSARVLCCWFGLRPGRRGRVPAGLIPRRGGVVLDVAPAGVDAAFACYHAVRDGLHPLMAAGHLLHLLGHLAAAPRCPAAHPAWLGRVLAEIARDPAHDDLERLRRLSGLGRSAFHSAFRRATGSTPHDLIVGHRLTLGASLLREDPDLAVAAVARRVGFGSYDAFSRAFRRQHGVAPQAWRNLDVSREAGNAPRPDGILRDGGSGSCGRPPPRQRADEDAAPRQGLRRSRQYRLSDPR